MTIQESHPALAQVSGVTTRSNGMRLRCAEPNVEPEDEPNGDVPNYKVPVPSGVLKSVLPSAVRQRTGAVLAEVLGLLLEVELGHLVGARAVRPCSPR